MTGDRRPTAPRPPRSPADRAAVQRRTLTVVVVAQMLGGAGLAAGVTVGALLAQDMLGGDALAGLPVALTTAGSASAAYAVGRLSQRRGRRVGLAAGFGVGALGALGIVVAAVLDSPVLLFAALFVYGSGTATNLQARYAGTDLATPERRGTAVSTALVATTVGAVAGPLSVDELGSAAAAAGLPALAGPFALAALAFGAAAVVVTLLLRPDPLLLARAEGDDGLRAGPRVGPRVGGGFADLGPRARAGVVTGAAVMVVTQVAMVAIMTMTPVHLRPHHGLGDIGLVIALHITAMFLPSLVTGRLVDRLGRDVMALAGAAVLLAAGLVAALAPAESLGLLVLALVLLGLGWNIGLISGTTMLVDATDLTTRARVQGGVDVLIAVSGSGAGVLSGFVVAGSSFFTLSLVGGASSLLLLPFLLHHRRVRLA
ncbi:MFS transporter [Kineococcus gynurae]|uniref:MFS transporter n=1 Tax=Kineococcus gynurae TaxID=452979 RepID=A0ABV5LVF9_9ACTN